MEDCLRLIFVLLRPRDMLPFRLVSKDWYDVSNDKNVINDILKYSFNATSKLFKTFTSLACFLYCHTGALIDKRMSTCVALIGLYESGRYDNESYDLVYQLLGDKEKHPRGDQVDALYRIENGLPVTGLDRFPTRTIVGSIYGHYTVSGVVAAELLDAVVKYDRVDVLPYLFPLRYDHTQKRCTDDRGEITEAVRYVLRLVCKYRSRVVYEWIGLGFNGNIAQQVYTYAVRYSDVTLLSWFSYMKPGLLRLARELRNEESVRIIQSM